MNKLFDGINEKDRKKIIKELEGITLNYKKNSSILSSIDKDNIIGIIVLGCAQIIRTDYNGNKTVIEELNDDDIFGSTLSSLNNSEYNIIVKEDTKLIIIDYNRVLTYDNNYSSYYSNFLKNLLTIITDKVAIKNERIQILTKKTIRDKLLEYFSIEKKKKGSKIIYLSFSISDLANYLAVDRCAMSRELKHLKEEKFIEMNGRKITLLY